ncbi:class I SAM-dependent methyltransferase [Paenibacillus physcomitrellae]|uniref:SAM-dependent methyltransferase n=1 Tax=Paenibacillus physcomitrellae TaxID=1619311 RepID=A0ABQ1G705_9BACL|nr:class I SAM-dependent methyltransferase [Paenibacillus physcomitrellae]GGA37970.1 SAM-dependent methyltransferase [Paenibacillus physcomitrellae]
MGFPSVLSFARQLVSQRLQPGDTAVDATVGTGADTLFLAEACGRKGQVFGFDIQAEALSLAAQRLAKARETGARLAPVSLLERSHAEMAAALDPRHHGRVGAVMFNLGYLPSEDADKAVITLPDSTIEALDASLGLLRPRGLITAVVYPGHDGGAAEAERVEAWARELPSASGQTIIYRQLQRAAAPYLIAIEKK